MIFEILRLAWKHIERNHPGMMRSSATICFDDALTLASEGKIVHAANRACMSLKYTAGIMSPDYTYACEVAKRIEDAHNRHG